MSKDLEFCFLWKTERPYRGIQRMSSHFSMLGEQWSLFLAVASDYILNCDQNDMNPIRCRIYLTRISREIFLGTDIRGSCDVVRHNKFFPSTCKTEFRTVTEMGGLIHEFDYHAESTSLNEVSKDWKVYCRLSAAEPLSLQIRNEIIQIWTAKDKDPPRTSTDQCVQTSSGTPLNAEVALSRDIARMLEQEVLPDFRLICESRTFPAHKSVLSARSDIFANIVRNTNESGSVEIKDIKAPALDLLLKYAYSGRLDNVTEDSAAGLYEAAEKYAVHHLRSECSSWMANNLTQENCFRYLLVADSHSDTDLKSAAISFVVEHLIVLRSAAWDTFSKENPVLAVEVSNAVFEDWLPNVSATE